MTNTVLRQLPLSGIAGKIRSIALATLLGFGAAFAAGSVAQALEEVNISDGYAVHGYDVVAYFTVGQPTKGVDRFAAEYQGATYRFANAAHRDTFTADPAKYAPQYGGYCAFGTAVGRKFDGDPNAWRIVDGKLYLNVNKQVQARWLKDTAGFIRSADRNWSIIANLPDSQLASNPPEGLTLGAS